MGSTTTSAVVHNYHRSSYHDWDRQFYYNSEAQPQLPSQLTETVLAHFGRSQSQDHYFHVQIILTVFRFAILMQVRLPHEATLCDLQLMLCFHIISNLLEQILYGYSCQGYYSIKVRVHRPASYASDAPHATDFSLSCIEPHTTASTDPHGTKSNYNTVPIILYKLFATKNKSIKTVQTGL
ncbi:hypothetical protein SFRURICE_006100 [Spodoptera frugiperda]|nr:hypothetical protein SFRURICE_006100 [Spodoptera frugiperda]